MVCHWQVGHWQVVGYRQDIDQSMRACTVDMFLSLWLLQLLITTRISFKHLMGLQWRAIACLCSVSSVTVMVR